MVVQLKKITDRACFSLAVLVCAALPICAADPMTESVTRALTAEKILDAGRFTVALYPSTHEAIISAFANNASKDLQKDCKIDAVLIAKKVMETDTSVMRVKSRFYHPSRTVFREVLVTKTDIVAFSKGSVSKDDLLNSLEVKPYSAGEAPPAASRGSTPGSSAASAALPIPKPEDITNDKVTMFRYKELSFYYPKVWEYKPLANQWGDFAELSTRRGSWCAVTLRLTDKLTVQEVAADDDRWYWKLNKRTIIGQKPITFGAHQQLHGLLVYVKDESRPEEPGRVEEYIYFGQSHHIYRFTVRFAQPDVTYVHYDLGIMFGTMSVQ